jgi:hypothetical protein
MPATGAARAGRTGSKPKKELVMKNFSLKKTASLLLMGAALAALTLAACGKRSGAEKAGEKVDEAVEDTKDGAKDLIDKDGPLEEAGEKVDEKLDGDK